MSPSACKADDLIQRIQEILTHREIKRVSIEASSLAQPPKVALWPGPLAKGPLTKGPPSASALVRAGVLLPLFCKDGSYHILFTRRTDKVKRHKGEISFPGGIYDSSDGDLEATALREAD
ncbi:MAG TPA: NUDIX domain-containing protein, partial [Thermodesulfobacteriota bacterium]